MEWIRNKNLCHENMQDISLKFTYQVTPQNNAGKKAFQIKNKKHFAFCAQNSLEMKYFGTYK